MARRKPKLDGDVKRRLMIVDYRTRLTDGVKKTLFDLERHSKGQFYKNTAYLFRDVPYFAFVDTNAVLRKSELRTPNLGMIKLGRGRRLRRPEKTVNM